MKKRYLTLNYVWSECIKMYTYVAKKKQAGSELTVNELKIRWVNRHGYKANELADNCFFCEYNKRHQPIWEANCKFCPAKLVNSTFRCSYWAYGWSAHPDLFFKEILRLDKKRRAK